MNQNIINRAFFILQNKGSLKLLNETLNSANLTQRERAGCKFVIFAKYMSFLNIPKYIRKNTHNLLKSAIFDREKKIIYLENITVSIHPAIFLHVYEDYEIRLKFK